MITDTIPPLEGEADDPQSMTLSDIYMQILANNEIILTIPADEEERLRKGLAGVKAKTNKKLLEEGLPVENSTLSYSVTPSKDEAGKERDGIVDVQICLSKKYTITVFDLKLPDNEL